MQNFLKSIVKFVDIIDSIVQKIIVVFFSVMMVVLLGQVILRYIFNYSFSWSAELSRYLLVWVIFLAGGKGLVTGAHMSIDLLLKLLPDKLKNAIMFLSNTVVFLFLLFIGRQGLIVISKISSQTSPALRLPMSIPYAAVPIGSFIMALYMLKIIITSNILRNEEGCQ